MQSVRSYQPQQIQQASFGARFTLTEEELLRARLLTEKFNQHFTAFNTDNSLLGRIAERISNAIKVFIERPKTSKPVNAWVVNTDGTHTKLKAKRINK